MSTASGHSFEAGPFFYIYFFTILTEVGARKYRETENIC
jgi:hypothetical protein